MILFLINSKLISKIEINSIKEFEHFYLEKMKLTKVYKTILQKVKIDDAIYAELKEITEDLIEKFKKGGKA
jgi:F0F1-type ATP synthase alpha subunit